MNKTQQPYLTYCLDIPKLHLRELGMPTLVNEIPFDESYYLTLILSENILIPSLEEENEDEAQRSFEFWNDLYEGALELLETELEHLSDETNSTRYPELSEKSQQALSNITEYLVEVLNIKVIRPIKATRPETRGNNSILFLAEVVDFGDVYRLLLEHMI